MATKKRTTKGAKNEIIPREESARKENPPSGGDICFVIMPFGGYSDSYFGSVYVPAIEAVGLAAHRADDLYGPQAIVSDIWGYTQKARVILADLTNKNPNVFYELGLAHASAKPVVMIAASIDDVPFDLRALRILVYDKNRPNWGEALRESIEKALREVLASPLERILPIFLKVSERKTQSTVTLEQKEVLELKRDMDLLKSELLSDGRAGTSRRWLSEREFGPDEARSYIRALARNGFDESTILDRAVSRGAPRMWAKERIAQEMVRFGGRAVNVRNAASDVVVESSPSVAQGVTGVNESKQE
ncbi:hypothetical protein HUA74_02635 [Myxococcus sp. CA051A]|uniref:hypothetical protein n=1 Tax=Myxococcus sp. CA051A TaxID=2741739 RepID=UPI00157B3402|nr:hypothetical protein [Myxococcus sp. CA051A]NTX59550.1 hypothetical protein [Myxococcus sp. CA051A]